MTMLHLSLPDDVAEKLRAQAALDGHASVDDYIQEMLRAHTDLIDNGRPEGILSDDDPGLEAQLLARLNDSRPSIDVTPEFWSDLKRRAGNSHPGSTKS